MFVFDFTDTEKLLATLLIIEVQQGINVLGNKIKILLNALSFTSHSINQVILNLYYFLIYYLTTT